MRLTYLGINYAPEPTGIGVYASSLATGLARLGHQVRVVTGYPHYPQWRVHEGYSGHTMDAVEQGVRVRRLRHYVPNTPSLLRRAAMELHFGLRAILTDWGRPEAVIVTSPALLAAALIRLRAGLSGIPVVVWVQDIYSLGLPQTGGGGWAARLLAWIEGVVVRGPQATVVIHDRFAEFITRELGAPAQGVHVIRNWSHLPDRLPGRSGDFRQRQGWQPDDVVVLHAGNMGAKQGLENVVEAARLAAEQRSRVRFVLLGDGNQRRRLQELDGSGRLQFVDPLPDAQFLTALTSADILLVNEMPGLTEMSVPSKLTSYFTTGLPVLGAVDQSSVTAAELAAAGGALRVAAADPQGLLAAAEQLADDPGAALVMGARNRRFRRRHLSAETALTKFNTILAAVRRPSPR